MKNLTHVILPEIRNFNALRDERCLRYFTKCFNREHRQFCNDRTGLESLVLWVEKAEVSRVIFEATGVYHRLPETPLATHCIPFSRVNPGQAWRFCKGAGQLARTDRVDAAMLARMGSLLELKVDQPKNKTLHDLKLLATARLALIKDRSAAKATAGHRNTQFAHKTDQAALATG